jgi:outer membrane protein, multidrug efflux system
MNSPVNSLLAAACLAAPLLAACQSPGTSASAALIAQEAQAIPAGWSGADAAAKADWSAAFSDPVLLGYLARGQSENFDVQIAEARLAQVAALRDAAASRLGPSLGLGGRAGTSSPLEDSQYTDSFGLDATASLDVTPWGNSRAGLASADAALRGEAARAETIRQAVGAAIVRAYYNLIEADLLLGVAAANFDFQTQTRAIVTVRFKAGEDARDSQMLADAEFESARAALVVQEASVRDAHRALSVLIGDFPAEDLAQSGALDVALALPARGVPADVLRRRPDVAAAEAGIAAAEAELWRARRARLPRLALTGVFGGTTGDISDLFDPAAYAAALGASFASVLFDSGGLSAATRGVAARAEEARLQYAQALRAGAREIDSAYDRAGALQIAVAANLSAVTAGREALRLERIKYASGDTDLIDLLTIQRQVNGLEIALIRARADRVDAMVAAYVATGGAIAQAPPT